MAVANTLDESVEWYSKEDNFRQEIEWMESWLKEASVEEPERVALFLDVIPSIRYDDLDLYVRTRANTFLIEYAVMYHSIARAAQKEGRLDDFTKYEIKKQKVLDLCEIVSPNGRGKKTDKRKD